MKVARASVVLGVVSLVSVALLMLTLTPMLDPASFPFRFVFFFAGPLSALSGLVLALVGWRRGASVAQRAFGVTAPGLTVVGYVLFVWIAANTRIY